MSLPILRDEHGQQIREFDILRVFHFYGRKRGKGYERHYMYKIARIWDWPDHGKQWLFFHSADFSRGLENAYVPYQQGWSEDQTLIGVEVLDSPETLRIENEKRRIDKPEAADSGE